MLVFLLSLVWDCRAVMFQLLGVYCSRGLIIYNMGGCSICLLPEMGQSPPFRMPIRAPPFFEAAGILNLPNSDLSALRHRQEYKRLLQSNKSGERHCGLITWRETLRPFAIPIAAPSWTFREDYFYSCVRAPYKS